jgi:hypothetical protein
VEDRFGSRIIPDRTRGGSFLNIEAGKDLARDPIVIGFF